MYFNKLKLMRRFSSFNSLVAILSMFIMFCITGCIAGIPVAVKLIEKERQYTAKLEVPREADAIYQIVIRELEKIPDVMIIRKDDSKFTVEASRQEKVTRITASSSGAGKSLVTVTADAGKNWEESRDLAQRVVGRICQEVNMQCRLIVQ
jgi:hypothetical protein